MNNKQIGILGLAVALASGSAQAALTSYSSEGVDLVYSSVSDVTWTKNANLLGTLFAEQGFSTVVDAIIAVTPIIFDTPNYYDTPSNSGYHLLSAADFNSQAGQASWYGAVAFANYLNSIVYGGSDQWRLPTTNAIDGYNGTAGNELGQLFYGELGGTNGSAIPNTSVFDNERTGTNDMYWFNSEVTSTPFLAWVLQKGFQGGRDKGGTVRYTYAWAVTPGQIAAVPVPAAVWLFGSAMVGIGALGRRNRIFA